MADSLEKPRIKEFRPENRDVVGEPSITQIGSRLSNFILYIISGFLLFIVIYLLFDMTNASDSITIHNNNNLADSLIFNRNLEVLKLQQEEASRKREFIINISQMVLLNLLLPTLTAILGYIFASNSKNKG
jgi:Na+/H+ antiporter NhaC